MMVSTRGRYALRVMVDLAEQLSSGSSPVVIAQVSEDYAPEFDNWDEAHPNARGEVKIAEGFTVTSSAPETLLAEGVKITAKKAGKATVTVTVGGTSKSFDVTVTDAG